MNAGPIEDQSLRLVTPPKRERSALHGHLHLTCSRDAGGRSYLSAQSFQAPFHISKPYWDGRTLTMQMVNPTAGLFAGDRLRSAVDLEGGAQLNLTTASATRLHTMPTGRAEVVQQFSVAKGARLSFVPSILVPHRNSRYSQTSRITVEPGGELLYVEMLAPGRVAHRECFEYTELHYELELYWGGRLNARECFRLRPDDASLKSITSIFPHAYWASAYLITEQLSEEHPALTSIRQLHSPDAFVGLSRLPLAGWSVKMITRDSFALHRTLASLRQILSQSVQFAFGLERVRERSPFPL